MIYQNTIVLYFSYAIACQLPMVIGHLNYASNFIDLSIIDKIFALPSNFFLAKHLYYLLLYQIVT